MARLSRTETRLCGILRRKAGEVATYSDFAPVISVKRGTANLRAFMSRLRRIRGLDIETVRGIGYRLRQKQPNQIWTDIARALGAAIGEVMYNNLPASERDKFVQALVESIARDSVVSSDTARQWEQRP